MGAAGCHERTTRELRRMIRAGVTKSCLMADRFSRSAGRRSVDRGAAAGRVWRPRASKHATTANGDSLVHPAHPCRHGGNRKPFIKTAVQLGVTDHVMTKTPVQFTVGRRRMSDP